MNSHESPKSPTVYLSGLPSLGSEEIALYNSINAARVDLVTQLSAKGCKVDDIQGARPSVKNMVLHAEKSDAFIFPPMTSLNKEHPRFKSEAAQRWFEFFSLVTGVHVGSREKYGSTGVSKPCIVIDPDNQWSLAIDLLKDLHNKGMFTSNVEDIVQIVHGNTANPHDYHAMNKEAVETLDRMLTTNRGKPHKKVKSQHPDDYDFQAFRKEMGRCSFGVAERHPFGVAVFGSATTGEKTYKDSTFKLAEYAGERGWRMVTGAGMDGCMGAADEGFEVGKTHFNKRYPDVQFRPAHIGVSTQPILRLEGPPEHLEQLIITKDIYDRMKLIINGQKSSNPLERLRDAVRVLFVAPGGTGTLHEFATLLQLATNGEMMKDRTIVLLNPTSHINQAEGFWDPLLATAKKLGFDSHFKVAKTAEEAIGIADEVYKDWLTRYKEYENLPHPVFNPTPNMQDAGWAVAVEGTKRTATALVPPRVGS